MRLHDKRFLILSAFSCLIIYVFATALFIQPAHAETSQLTPDWTSVTHDFFNLSPGTTNPVLTPADITDRVASYVADPFMFKEGNTWYMFFEISSSGVGDIGLATSSDGFHWTYRQVVLDESFLLAYPVVFKWNGTYYMVPESYTENQIRLYKATDFPYTWTFVNTLVSGGQFVDPSIFRYNNAWWMFAPTTSYNTYLYYSDNLTDPASWHEHPMSPIVVNDTSKARGGGRPIVFNGNHIIRLAQKWGAVYGEAVRAFQVDTLTKTSYSEHEIPQSPIVQASGSGWNKDGMHTVDPWWTGDRWLAAVDGVNYQPSEVWSIGVYVSPVFAYQLTITSNYGTVSPPSGFYDASTTITITATPPAASSGERYVWLGWTGSGSGSYTGLDNPASITMSGPINQTASWRPEYYLTVTSPYGTPSGQGWYEAGSTAYATLATGNVSGGAGIRYIFTGWTGNASGTGLTSNAITMNDSKTAIANWKTQHYLKVNNGGRGTASGEGWYDSGTSATFSINPISVYEGAEKRYAFTNWSGNSTSTNSSDNIIMNEPKTVTANWKTQYQVTFGQTGLDTTATGTVATVDGSAKTSSDLPFSKWVDSGSSVTYTYADPITSSVSGSRFELSSASGPVSPITVSGPISVTATYKTQYYLNVASSYGTVGGMGWYDSGATAHATLTPLIVNGSTGIRYVFTNWSGNASGTTSPSDSITMNAPKTATANYKEQFLVVFQQTGLPDGVTANVVVNSVKHNLPYSDWFDKGSTINFAYDDQLSRSFGTRYVLTSTSEAAPMVVGGYITLTGYYSMQYTMEIGLISVPIILGGLAIGILFVRKRKKSSQNQ